MCFKNRQLQFVFADVVGDFEFFRDDGPTFHRRSLPTFHKEGVLRVIWR